MYHEIDVLKLVCLKLDQANVPYMLTGSFAANFYAIPRMTRDIDIVLAVQKSDISRLYQLFADDFYIDRDSISEAVNHSGMFNIIHNDSVFKIDFIIRKNDPYRTLEFQRKRNVQLDNTKIWIVAPEDLIISKLFWAKDSFSEIQIRDVKNLISSITHLDYPYIREWVRKLELNSIYERLQING
ncbi:hypothetical protein [Parachlamydia acanthamoebae]|uniref:hypothetical protein n=1 Tax=Parachlamydia acanthamoebae TaxID=83552 RepID=UPI0024E21ABA|nr:hypothetical protein [Parachlamydia acanthamoebae]